MRIALITSWVLFTSVFAIQSIADEYHGNPALGWLEPKSLIIPDLDNYNKVFAHLDKEELEAIAKACKQ